MEITHKGSRIFYTDQGVGATIILLHGFLENSSMWNDLLPFLIKKHRVICIDLLGHGKTACLGYVHTMQDFSDAVLAVMNELHIHQSTIIGHSMGGYVGIAFAKAYPEKVNAICLLNATPEADSKERKQVRLRANEMAKTQYKQLVRMSFMNLFDPTSKAQFSDTITTALHHALQTPVQGYIASNEGMRLREDTSDFWKSAPFKKGMILGETDWIIDAQRQKDTFTPYIDHFAIIKGGHMSHISNKDVVIKHVLSFLD
ncbi:alpha/beta hydrolase [uncultured Dokdonia sp.]|uniref:alpha/beta fold hydrolase n=1 Tax=uncultured Dokdonia sp. TaxID=575653 RepID=UPI00262959EF|nr:alpha/beta hydrolase [uncultured Dokdonia sp.]